MTSPRFLLSISLTALFLGFALAPSARAGEWDKKTTVTLNSPVRIPGKVLAPGTYVFKLVNTVSERDILLIYNEAENDLIASVTAIPTYRLEAADQTVMALESPEPGAMPRITKWFYPGDLDGLEFVYSDNPRITRAPASKPEPAAAEPAQR